MKNYSQEPDGIKIAMNWHKTRMLFNRGEYSVAIMRAATVVELAANLVVREELVKNSGLPIGFVDSLLKSANGLRGKFDKIILPLAKGAPREGSYKALRKALPSLLTQRNRIVHSGQFKKKQTAHQMLLLAKRMVEGLIKEYRPPYKLEGDWEEQTTESSGASRQSTGDRRQKGAAA